MVVGGGFFFNKGVGVVVVNGLEVLRLGAIPHDIGIRFAAERNVADQILNKNRVRIRLLGHVLFIRPFEQAEQLSAGGFLAEANHIFDPHGFLAADGKGGVAALVVRARSADGL